MAKYKGGGGSSGGDPIPFPVNDASVQSNPIGRRQSPAVRDSDSSRSSSELLNRSMKDPQSLLAAVKESSGSSQGCNSIREAKEASALETSGPGSEQGDSRQHRESRKLLEVGNQSNVVDPRSKQQGQHPAKERAGNSLDIRFPGSLTEPVGSGLGTVRGAHSGSTEQGSLISEIMEISGKPKISEIHEVAENPEIPEVAKNGEAAGMREDQASGDANLVRAVNEAGETEHNMGRKAKGVAAVGPAVKKGFLSKLGEGKTTSLYPEEGSENGAEPGAYAKLMGRCKVVDTSTMSKEQVNAAMRAHAGDKPGSGQVREFAAPSSSGPALPIRSSSGEKKAGPAVRKGFLQSGKGGTLYGEEGSGEGGGGQRFSAETKSRIDRQFEKLVADADPDMGSVQARATMSEETEDPITEQLAQLAKVLGPSVALFPKTKKDSACVPSTVPAKGTNTGDEQSPNPEQASNPSMIAETNGGGNILTPANGTPDSFASKAPSTAKYAIATSLPRSKAATSGEGSRGGGASMRPGGRNLPISPGGDGLRGQYDGDKVSHQRSPRGKVSESGEGRPRATSGCDNSGKVTRPETDDVDLRVSTSNGQPATSSGSADNLCLVDSPPCVAALCAHHGEAQSPRLLSTVHEYDRDRKRSGSSRKTGLAFRDDVSAGPVAEPRSSSGGKKAISKLPSPCRERALSVRQGNAGGRESVLATSTAPTTAGSSSALLPGTGNVLGDRTVSPATSPTSTSMLSALNSVPPRASEWDIAGQLSPKARVSTKQADAFHGKCLGADPPAYEGLIGGPGAQEGCNTREHSPSSRISMGKGIPSGEVVEETPGIFQGCVGGEWMEREPLYKMEVLPANPTTVNGKRQVIIAIDLPEVIEDKVHKPLDGRSNPGSEVDSPVCGEGAPGQRGQENNAADTSCPDSARKASSGDARDIAARFELDVTSRGLELRVPGLYKLFLEMPFPVDVDGVTAIFSKPRAALCVSAWER